MKRIFYTLLLSLFVFFCIAGTAQAQSCDDCAVGGNGFWERGLGHLMPKEDACDACSGSPSCDALCTCNSGSQSGFYGTVFFDALFFDRDAPDNLGGNGLVSANDGRRLLDTGDLDPSADVGYRVGMFLRSANMGIFEIAYLHDDWDVGRGVSGANSLNVIPGTVDFTLADHVEASYDSDLDSFELNRWGRLSNQFFWMFGVRHLSLDERFTVSGFDSGFRSDANINTDNSLYGLQLGARHQSCSAGESLVLNLSGKFGLYENTAKQQSRLNDVNNTVALFNFSNEDSASSFVGDIEASLSLRLSENLSGRLGYQVLWINDVALAPEQFQRNTSATSVSINNDGKILVHGVYAGMEMHW